ncbi:MAG: hypothetical protein R3F20_19550 [Planctomycetota bacterium]
MHERRLNALLLLALVFFLPSERKHTQGVVSLDPPDPRALSITLVAEHGDSFGGERFNRAVATETRREQLAAGKTNEEASRFGLFRFRFRSPPRGENESDEDFRLRALEERAKLALHPEEGQGEWLVDPEALGRWHGIRPVDALTFADAFESRDGGGGKDVTLAVRPDRRRELEALTNIYLGRSMALVVDGEMMSVATLAGPLRDEIQVTRFGGYSADEVDRIFRVLGKSR